MPLAFADKKPVFPNTLPQLGPVYFNIFIRLFPRLPIEALPCPQRPVQSPLCPWFCSMHFIPTVFPGILPSLLSLCLT